MSAKSKAARMTMVRVPRLQFAAARINGVDYIIAASKVSDLDRLWRILQLGEFSDAPEYCTAGVIVSGNTLTRKEEE